MSVSWYPRVCFKHFVTTNKFKHVLGHALGQNALQCDIWILCVESQGIDKHNTVC